MKQQSNFGDWITFMTITG